MPKKSDRRVTSLSSCTISEFAILSLKKRAGNVLRAADFLPCITGIPSHRLAIKSVRKVKTEREEEINRKKPLLIVIVYINGIQQIPYPIRIEKCTTLFYINDKCLKTQVYLSFEKILIKNVI